MIIGEEKEKQLLKKWKCLFGKLLTVEKRSTGQNGPVDRNLKIYTLYIYVHVHCAVWTETVDRIFLTGRPVLASMHNQCAYIYLYIYVYIY